MAYMRKFLALFFSDMLRNFYHLHYIARNSINTIADCVLRWQRRPRSTHVTGIVSLAIGRTQWEQNPYFCLLLINISFAVLVQMLKQ